MKFRHATLIAISGSIWLAIGFMLMQLGVNLLMSLTFNARFHTNDSSAILKHLAPFMGGIEEAAVAVLALGVFIGYFKGKYVLSKSVIRGVNHIRSLPTPAHILKIYSLKYNFIIGAMILMGVSIKYFGIPKDIRGVIDVAVGCALINGAVLYFKQAYNVWKEGY